MVHAANAASECLEDKSSWVNDTHAAWGRYAERLQRSNVNVLYQWRFELFLRLPVVSNQALTQNSRASNAATDQTTTLLS